MQTKLIFVSLVFFLIVSLSSFDSNVQGAKEMTRLVVAKTVITVPVLKISGKKKTEFKTDVYFMKGEYFVPVSAKKEIKEMFENAKKTGKIYAAKIISWGDQLRPINKNTSLSGGQLKLVEDRNDNLEAYLERLDIHMRVMKISMAERPDVMNGLLSREDRILKNTLDNTIEISPSKSIVMFLVKYKPKRY